MPTRIGISRTRSRRVFRSVRPGHWRWCRSDPAERAELGHDCDGQDAGVDEGGIAMSARLEFGGHTPLARRHGSMDRSPRQPSVRARHGRFRPGMSMGELFCGAEAGDAAGQMWAWDQPERINLLKIGKM